MDRTPPAGPLAPDRPDPTGPAPTAADPDSRRAADPSAVRAPVEPFDDPLPDDPQTRALVGELHRLLAFDHLFSRAPSPRAPRFARRQAVVEALWDRAPFEPCAPRPLPEIGPGELTLPRFLDLSEGHHRPVVIRGFGADAAAVADWTAAGLAERVGPLQVTVAEMHRDPAAARAAQARGEGLPLHDMPLTEYVRRMHHEPLYLHNSGAVTAACPALLDELALDRIHASLCDPTETWDPIFSAALFVGTEQVYSNIHAAPGGNFFLQVRGRKRWTFVDPALSPYLGPLTGRPFNHLRSAYGTFHTAAPDCPIHRLPRYSVTLEPGDLLYNAPWWWHEVLNEGETIGCAMRYVSPPLRRSATWHNHRVFSGLSIWPQLWAASLVDYGRHRMRRLLGRERRGTLRAMVGKRTDRSLNRARGRST